MITIRLLMNGESPMMSPVSGLRSGAPGGSVSAAITASTASTARPAQRRPLASSAGSIAWPSSRASSSSSARPRSQVPSRGSMIRVVTSAITTVRNSVQPIAEVEVRDEVDLRVRVDQRGRLVGDVGDHRVGRDDQDVHANAALTAPKPAAIPASGLRPTLRNAVAASGISTR